MTTNEQFADEKLKPELDNLYQSVKFSPDTLDDDERGRVMDLLRMAREAAVVSEK